MLKHLFMKRIPMAPLLGVLACICLILSACQKEYSIETNVSLAAQGTLKDTTNGECMPDSVVGTFYGGIEPGRDTAYVLVNVMVTNPGTYTIYTDTQDGFYFSDSGYFANAGLNVIKLKPVGTPIIPGTYPFNITFDTSICGFTVNVQDSTGTGLGGGTTNPNTSDSAWTFTGPVGSYNGPIDSAFTYDSSGIHYMVLLGSNKAHDTAWQVGVAFTGGAITPGEYSSKSSSLFGFNNAVTGDTIYLAYPLTPTVETKITIVSYDTSTRIVTGTYSGTARDSGGNSVSITAGTFKAKVD